MTLRATTVGWLQVDLDVPAGQTVAVVGPNGAGKTTLLRALAGLPARATADVSLAGRDLRRVPVHRRPVGWMPQDGALFPHLSALDNAAYGLRARGVGRREARGTADEWLHRLDVGELAARRPADLSGGEAQRVALARAFAAGPDLLLLDEPLSALDTASRSAVRGLLRRHLASYAGVCLLVTHDVVEAVALADRVLVLEGGRAVQDAGPAEVTRVPRSRWVAELFGWNAWTGRAGASGLVLPDGYELVAAEPLPVGAEALARVSPAAVAVHPQRPAGSARNVWAGQVVELSPAGSRTRVRVRAASGAPEVVAEVTPGAVAELGIAEGAEVWVAVKATEVALTRL